MPVLAERIERLNRISERRVIDPDAELPGSVGEGQLVPDELLSTHGLDIELRRSATRPVLATMIDAGVFGPGRVPKGWRELCGVDRRNEPVRSV